MKRFLVLSTMFLAIACSTDDRFDKNDDKNGGKAGSPSKEDAAVTAGLCELSKCPRPEVGLACCTPLAQCGTDPSGLGLTCAPNSGGATSDLVCDLSECPEPTVGIACCTPFAQCGFDPFSSGLWCFSNPVDVTPADADGAVCDLDKCPAAADGGPAACCLPNGDCGQDTWGLGICFPPPPPAVDAAMPDYGSVKPDDPSITAACGAFVDPAGAPVWGCCTVFGYCGTFRNGSCQLAPNTVVPAVPDDEDAGGLAFPFCTPPEE